MKTIDPVSCDGATYDTKVFNYPSLRRRTPKIGFVLGIPLFFAMLFISMARDDVGGVIFSSVLLFGFLFLCWKGWHQYAAIYYNNDGIGRIVKNKKTDEIKWETILSVNQKMDLDPYYGRNIRIYVIKARSRNSEGAGYKYLRFDEKLLKFGEFIDGINSHLDKNLRIF